jgi:putative endonuclease
VPKINEWFVYIIRTEKNRLYTGITTDVERRFKEHSGEKTRGAKFFRSDRPQEIVYIESCKTRSEALKKEAKIKGLTRRQKDSFIKGTCPVAQG